MCTKTINPNNHSAIFEPEYLLSMGCGKNRPTIFSFRTGASAIVSVISYLLTAIIKSLNVNNEQLGKMGRPPCRDDDRAQRLEKILIRGLPLRTPGSATKYEPGGKEFHETLLSVKSGDPVRSSVGQSAPSRSGVLDCPDGHRPSLARGFGVRDAACARSEEHTSELHHDQISYAVF